MRKTYRGLIDSRLARPRIDGLGIATYVNGDVYEGTFRAGVPQGEGLMRYATGEERLGMWDKGELVEETLPDPATEGQPDSDTTEPADAPETESEQASEGNSAGTESAN